MKTDMRLQKIQDYMKQQNMEYQYFEEDDCGSINFIHRGLSYHIWEYQENGIRGAESNILSCGRSIDYEGDYEEQLLEVFRTTW